MIGALIVFWGFYYKEVKLDKLTSFSAGLTTAKSKLEINRKIQEIDNKVDGLGGQITDLQTHGVNNSIFHNEYTIIEQQSQTYGADQDDLNFDAQVLPELPYSRTALKNAADRLHDRVLALTALQEKTLNAVDRAQLASAQSGSRIDKTAPYRDVMNDADQFVPATADFHSQVASLEKSVDDEISNQSAAVSASSARATHISDSLFVAGWLLGLAGKVFKIPALGGE